MKNRKVKLLCLLIVLVYSACNPSNNSSSNKSKSDSKPDGSPTSVNATISVSLETQSATPSQSQTGKFTVQHLMSVQEQSTLDLNQVARITVEVWQADKSIKPAQELTKNSSGWTLQITNLPANVPLTFKAIAYNELNKQILTGSTVKTLSTNASISIPMSGKVSIDTFYVESIRLPKAINLSQSAAIIVQIKGIAEKSLSYSFTPAVSGGSFTPQNGIVILDSQGNGTITTDYSAPGLAGTYTHQVSLTDGVITVASSFSTQIVTSGGGGGGILINPWITDFSAGPRVGSNVQFKVTAADDQPVSNLLYQWTFTGTAQYPTVGIINSATSEAVLVNYNQNVTGTITVSVTDADGGSTVLNFTLTPGLFPDCVINCNAPIARAGSDFYAEVNRSFALDGSSSSDPNGILLTFKWDISKKPLGSNATLQNNTTATPSFIPDKIGIYTLSLTVSNGSLTDADYLLVNVTSSEAGVTKPTVKLEALSSSSYKLQLLSPSTYQSRGLTGMGGVSITCSGLSTAAGFNNYSINTSTIGQKTIFGFVDLDNELTPAGSIIDICSFTCSYQPEFSLTDSVSVSYEQAGTVSGTSNIDYINP